MGDMADWNVANGEEVFWKLIKEDKKK